MRISSLSATPDTTREMSLVLCVHCMNYKEEKQFKVPKHLSSKRTYTGKMIGSWYAKCSECRDDR